VDEKTGRLWFEGLGLSEFVLTVTGPKGTVAYQETMQLLDTVPRRVTARVKQAPPPKKRPAGRSQGKGPHGKGPQGRRPAGKAAGR
jgi:hypothetical protein